jgi:D-alanine-D-alanine ligase-like ATP-grasp enzyme
MVLDHYKIPTAPFTTIPARMSWPKSGYNPLDATEVSAHSASLKKFPLFVKPSSISDEIGINQTNKVADREELLQAIERISKQYPRDNLLVERYLPGSEFTVGILGTGADAKLIGVRELVFVKNGRPGDSTFVYNDDDPNLEEDIQ